MLSENDDEFEVEDGKALAAELVEHVKRMGATDFSASVIEGSGKWLVSVMWIDKTRVN
jgi:hypothetical protein